VITLASFLYPGSKLDSEWAKVKLFMLGDSKLLENLKSYKVADCSAK
jgi:hypothetical protein